MYTKLDALRPRKVSDMGIAAGCGEVVSRRDVLNPGWVKRKRGDSTKKLASKTEPCMPWRKNCPIKP